MKKHCIWLGILLVSPSISSAQTQMALIHIADRISPQTGTARNPLATKLTIDLKNVPLQEALAEIIKQSGVSLAYSKDAIPLQRPVSVTGTGISLDDALKQVLTGTSATVQPMGERTIAIGGLNNRQTPAADGIIVGKVVHEKTKQPIAGATVSVADASQSVTTGADGTFRLSATPGEHTVHVRALGFVRQAKRVVVTEDATVTVDVVLEPSANVLGEVIVTGTVIATERKAIPNPITVFTAEDIERRGITRIEEFFRGEVPGVIALEQGTNTYYEELGKNVTSQVYSRGTSKQDGSPNPLKTYVDGVELLDPSYLGTIDPKSIERIEIISGPQASTIYGSNAMGGVMQIFTKKGSGQGRDELTLNARYGVMENSAVRGFTPTHFQSLSFTGGNRDFSYAANASHNYSGQWQPSLFSRRLGAQAGLTLTRSIVTVSGSLALSTGRNGTGWRGSGLCFGGLIGCGGLTLVSSIGKAQGTFTGIYPTDTRITQRISNSSSQTSSISVDVRTGADWNTKVTVGRSVTAFSLDPIAPWYAYVSDSMWKIDTRNGQRTTVDINTSFVPSLSGFFSSAITVGGNGSLASATTLSGCRATKESQAYIACYGGSSGPTATTDLNDKNAGLFASTRFGFFDVLYLTIGARMEQNTHYGRERRWDITPSNGLTATMAWGELSVKLLGSYGRTTRPPGPENRNGVVSFSETYTPASYQYILPAPLLRPEYSRGPSGGIEVYYGNLGSIAINHYRQKVNDLIQQVMVDSIRRVNVKTGDSIVSQIYQYQNVADLLSQGWDVSASLNLGRFSLKGVTSAASNKATATRQNYTVQDVPAHFTNLTFGYVDGRISMTLAANYTGATLRWLQSTLPYLYQRYARHGMYADAIKWGNQGGSSRVQNPGYWKSDLTGLLQLGPGVSATLNVKNLNNNYDAEVPELIPVLGRQTQIGLSVRFPRSR